LSFELELKNPIGWKMARQPSELFFLRNGSSIC